MNKKKILILLSLSLLLFNSFGQRKKNIKYAGFLFYDSYYFNGPLNFHLGGAVPFYSGDLCSGLGCNQINPGFLAGLSYKFAPGTYAALDYQYLQMGASDANASRAYTFSSTNHEVTAYVRYNFIKDIILKHYHMDQKPRFIKPYMKIGIGALLLNSTVAEANYDVLDTSGFANAASGIALVIPVGLGVSFNFSNRVSILLDGNYRYCFTDNLDAFNNSGNNDGYFTANLTISYSPWGKRLKPKKRKAPEGTTVPTGSGTTPSSGGGSGGTAKPETAPDTNGNSDDEIVPENTTPEPEEETELYEGYEEEPAEEEEESSEEDEYLDFDEQEGGEEEGSEEEYYDDSGW